MLYYIASPLDLYDEKHAKSALSDKLSGSEYSEVIQTHAGGLFNPAIPSDRPKVLTCMLPYHQTDYMAFVWHQMPSAIENSVLLCTGWVLVSSKYCLTSHSSQIPDDPRSQEEDPPRLKMRVWNPSMWSGSKTKVWRKWKMMGSAWACTNLGQHCLLLA